MKKLSLILIAVISLPISFGPVSMCNSAVSADRERLARLETQFEELRALLKIPGLSAVVVRDQKVLWAKGFGFADLSKRIPATPDTPFVIASLTKTFAATLVMQLVEQGKLDLNEPISKYSTDFKDESVKIKHLLSHTSEGTPGERYQYNGSRYNYLTAVIERVSGKSFRELLSKTFIQPLRMEHTVPGHDLLTEAAKWTEQLGAESLQHYQTVLAGLAQPHRLYGEEIIQTPYPPRGIGAAAGFISTVLDLGKYEAAVDRNQFLNRETQAQAWTAFVSNSGQSLPHGLGWFVRRYQGARLIWHYGYWPDSFSATLLKVPDQKLTLILLANSDALSAPFYRTGGIETNAFACAFLRLFVFQDAQGGLLPDPHWAQTLPAFGAEIARLSKQTRGYQYSCETASHTAMMTWLEARRTEARKPVKVDPRIYASIVGQYELNPSRTFTVSQEGDRLMIDMPRGSRSELFPESDTEFFLKVTDARLQFVKDEKQQTTHLEIQVNAQQLRARKIK